MKKNLPPKNPLTLKELIIYLILFNSLFVLSLVLQRYVNHPGDDPFYWTIGSTIERYYFSYHYEFMKKGFIGTILHYFNISPTRKLIYLISLINANFFLILYMIYLKKMTALIPKKQFSLFMLFFILSPAVALQFGYSAGLFDHFVILITLIILYFLAGKNKFSYIVLPILLAVGLLIHEGFLLFNIPVIFAVILNETRKGNFKHHLFFATSSTIIITLYFIFAHGGEISSETLHALLQKFPREKGILKETDFFSRTILDITSRTLKYYKYWQRWLGILLCTIILWIYLKPYVATFKKHKDNSFIFCVMFSPFAILPMFIVADTFYRWFGLILINMFMVYPYLINEFNISDLFKKFSRAEKVYVKIGFVLFLLGPIGIASALPYADAFLCKVFGFSPLVARP